MQITALAGGIGGARFLRGLLPPPGVPRRRVGGRRGHGDRQHRRRHHPVRPAGLPRPRHRHVHAGRRHRRGAGLGARGRDLHRARGARRLRGAAGAGSPSATATSPPTSSAPRCCGPGGRCPDVTAALCARWQPGVRLLPMSDDPVETHVVVLDDAGQRARRSTSRSGGCASTRPAPAQEFVFLGAAEAKPDPGGARGHPRRRRRAAAAVQPGREHRRHPAGRRDRRCAAHDRPPPSSVSRPSSAAHRCEAWPTRACPRSASRRARQPWPPTTAPGSPAACSTAGWSPSRTRRASAPAGVVQRSRPLLMTDRRGRRSDRRRGARPRRRASGADRCGQLPRHRPGGHRRDPRPATTSPALIALAYARAAGRRHRRGVEQGGEQGRGPGRHRRGRATSVIDDETVRVVARRGDLAIVETRHGLVLAAAGVDASNVEDGNVVLLPDDPDASARPTPGGACGSGSAARSASS